MRAVYKTAVPPRELRRPDRATDGAGIAAMKKEKQMAKSALATPKPVPV